MGKRILLIGGGGHCHSIIDSLLVSDEYEKIGIVDSNHKKGEVLFGINVVGHDDNLQVLFEEGWSYAFISVGSIGDVKTRKRLYEAVKKIGFILPNIVDKTAIVASDAELSEGIYVGKLAVINSGSKIGKCAILNTGSIIEHDCSVGEFSHVSTGAILCGSVKVGDDSHVGAGSVVRQQINIGKNVLIGIGSTVVSDIPNGVKAYGNPCRVVKE